jgi:hypothetical protein
VCVLLCAAPTIELVSAATSTLATAGGTAVDLYGRNMGATPSVVAVTYRGGSDGHQVRTYAPPPGTCAIVTAGTHIRCPTLPGVGANYTFTVAVDGVASAPSKQTLSYTQPAIASVTGSGAVRGPAAGNATILLRGTNFGPQDGSTILRVWAVPPQTTLWCSQRWGVWWWIPTWPLSAPRAR